MKTEKRKWKKGKRKNGKGKMKNGTIFGMGTGMDDGVHIQVESVVFAVGVFSVHVTWLDTTSLFDKLRLNSIPDHLGVPGAEPAKERGDTHLEYAPKR